MTYPLTILLIAAVVLVACGSDAPQQLPRIDLSPQQAIGWDKKGPTLVDEVMAGDTVTLLGRIKYRGGSSSKYWKHSYRLELDEAYPLVGLPTEDDWVINATHVDKTFMRHRLSYDLFREMAPERNLAPLCRFVELSEAGRYEGVYVLMQRVNGSFVGLDKKDEQAALFKDPPIFWEGIVEAETNAEVYEQKWPKARKRDMTASLDLFRDYLHLSSDSVFEAELTTWVDLDNIIDWHLLLLLSNNGDGLLKNFYLYRRDSHSPYRIAIWDYDHSYGRDGDYELNMLERMLDPRRNVLLRRLMDTDVSDYSRRMSSRWATLRSDLLATDRLMERISAMDAELTADAMARQTA